LPIINRQLKKKYILPILLPVQFIALKILALFPGFVERHYSNGLYVKLSAAERWLFGWISFSIGDVVYFTLIFWLIWSIWKHRKTLRSAWKDHVLRLVGVISVMYFLFNFFWGINYYRLPLSEQLGLQIAKNTADIPEQYTDAELLDFTKRLIFKVNEVQFQITKNDSAKVVFPYSQQQVFDKNVLGYRELSKQYSFLTYTQPSVKKSLISLPLTYMGFAGYLNPFTNEAQVNYKLPMYAFPTTTCHEMAHQLGYASESEANFIGYLASVKQQDLYYQYSGYAVALRYCLGNWEIRDEKTFETLIKTVNPGTIENFKDSQKFWDSYETFLETGFKVFYDNFLKLNQQDEGLESYNRFVDLLVNYYKTETL
jgi:hypothetical protein